MSSNLYFIDEREKYLCSDQNYDITSLDSALRVHVFTIAVLKVSKFIMSISGSETVTVTI